MQAGQYNNRTGATGRHLWSHDCKGRMDEWQVRGRDGGWGWGRSSVPCDGDGGGRENTVQRVRTGSSPVGPRLGVEGWAGTRFLTAWKLSLIHISEPTRPKYASRMPSSA